MCCLLPGFGALTLGIVRQGLFFAGVDYDWYQAILGLMLLAFLPFRVDWRVVLLIGAIRLLTRPRN